MTVMTDETEVRRAKRSWPAQYKLDILNEIEAAKESGETTVAEICRREVTSQVPIARSARLVRHCPRVGV